MADIILTAFVALDTAVLLAAGALCVLAYSRVKNKLQGRKK